MSDGVSDGASDGAHDGEAAPPGYVALARPGVRAVVRAACAATVRALLAEGTLYAYAERHPARRALMGRLPAYAVPLPGGLSVVVRHSHHGGLLAPLTGDRFLAPTRAPRELRTALRLRAAGVPTPEVIAIAVYAAGPALRRADVVTREVEGARDLSVALRSAGAAERQAAAEATATLLRVLAAAGARHPDLNIKNVLVGPQSDGLPIAYVLDVDRVRFEAPGSARAARANLRRLLRSLDRWRDRLGAGVVDHVAARVAGACGPQVTG